MGARVSMSYGAQGSGDQPVASAAAGVTNVTNASATATTLPAGAAATVSATLSDTSLRFTFGLPQGLQGETGPAGPAGPQGPQGPTGTTGGYITTLTLPAAWSGNGPYTQTVTISGYSITDNSKIDLQPDAATLQQLLNDGVAALFVSNSLTTLTAIAVGAVPTAALTVQATITEVTRA